MAVYKGVEVLGMTELEVARIARKAHRAAKLDLENAIAALERARDSLAFAESHDIAGAVIEQIEALRPMLGSATQRARRAELKFDFYASQKD